MKPKATTAPDVDRADPGCAEEIMKELCPAVADRRLVLGQLLSSIVIAERLASESYAAVLFWNGFRLNVGQVAVFDVFGQEVSLYLLDSVPDSSRIIGKIEPCVDPYAFRSMPQPQHRWSGRVGHLRQDAPLLQQSHAAFVRTAAVTKGQATTNNICTLSLARTDHIRTARGGCAVSLSCSVDVPAALRLRVTDS